MKIRYYGHNGMGTGYGRAADEMVEALALAGAELEVRPLAPPASWNRSAAVARFFRGDAELTQPDAIIIHTLPMSIPAVIAEITTTSHVVDTPMVAYTTWEARDVPLEVARSCSAADRLWVPSRDTERAFVDQDLEIPIDVMPHAYNSTLSREFPGRPPGKPFSFYYVGAWNTRKNPAGLIRTFCGEFTKDEPVELLLQCRGVSRETFQATMFSTGLPPDRWPRVQFSNTDISEPQLWMLHGVLGDVFVTASHGEAWNLGAFEAMLAGRHIIVPEGQGTDDFLLDTSANLYYAMQRAPAQLDIRVMPAAEGAPPESISVKIVGAQGLTSACQWQEPNLGDLATRMRNAYQMNLRTIDVHYDVAAEFGREAVGRRALSILQEMKS